MFFLLFPKPVLATRSLLTIGQGSLFINRRAVFTIRIQIVEATVAPFGLAPFLIVVRVFSVRIKLHESAMVPFLGRLLIGWLIQSQQGFQITDFFIFATAAELLLLLLSFILVVAWIFVFVFSHCLLFVRLVGRDLFGLLRRRRRRLYGRRLSWLFAFRLFVPNQSKFTGYSRLGYSVHAISLFPHFLLFQVFIVRNGLCDKTFENILIDGSFHCGK